MQRFHCVCGLSLTSVPLLVYLLLQVSQTLGIESQHGRVRRHTDIIHEDTKLSYAEVVHEAQFAHYAVEHIRLVLVGESVSRVYCPYEVHLGLVRRIRELSHHPFGEHSHLLLLGSDSLRISLVPILRMVRVALCSIHVSVHLVFRHKAEQVGCDLGRVGHTVVALYDTAILSVGIVVDVHAGEVAVLCLVKHLLERCQSAEHSVCRFAQDYQLSHVAVLSHGESMSVITFRVEDLAFQSDAFTLAVGKVAACIDAEIKSVLALYCLACHGWSDAMVCEHLLGAVESVGVDAVAGYDCHLSCQHCAALQLLLQLWHRSDVIDIVCHGDCRQQTKGNPQNRFVEIHACN